MGFIFGDREVNYDTLILMKERCELFVTVYKDKFESVEITGNCAVTEYVEN